MLSFLLSVLVSIGAAVLAVVMSISRREQLKRDPMEGMGAWDAVTGKAARASNEHLNQLDTMRRWTVSLTVFAVASGLFAVVRGVMLFGG